MTNRTHMGFLLLVLAVGLAGCNGAITPAPTAPSPSPQQTLQPANSGGDTFYMTNLTLSGMVYEMTPAGRVPIAGVQLWSSEQAGADTDSNGMYRVTARVGLPVHICTHGGVVDLDYSVVEGRLRQSGRGPAHCVSLARRRRERLARRDDQR